MSELSPENYMLDVNIALERVRSKVNPMGAELCALVNAEGRVLREDVIAKVSQPATPVSAMDGYAIRYEDLSSSCPITLNLIGEAPAGNPFRGKVGSGEAVRIFTGASLPKGADMVVIQENTKATDNKVEVLEAPKQGKNIRAMGSDFSKGDILAVMGKRISARDIGIIAAGNNAQVLVSKRPKIALLSTGDELRLPGQVKNKYEIVNSNSPMLKSLIEKMGAEAIELGIAKDNAASILSLASKAKTADMLVTIGGASVGDYDIVADTLEKLGFKLDFWKVAMRPGKPIIFGELYGPLLGLPGNPVSAMVGAVLFLVPMIEKFLGQTISGIEEVTARFGDDVPQNGLRQAYLRATMDISNYGCIMVTPLNIQDSAALNSFSKSGCLIIRPVNAPKAHKDDTCKIIPLSNI